MTEQCGCGKTYASEIGVDYCVSNGHGAGKDKYGDKMRFKNELQAPEITVVCAECTEQLRGYLRIIEGNIEVNVAPHICQVDAEEVAE